MAGFYPFSDSQEGFHPPPLLGIFKTLMAADFQAMEDLLEEEGSFVKKGTIGRALAALLRHSDHDPNIVCKTFLEHVESNKTKDSSKNRRLIVLIKFLLGGANGRMPRGGALFVDSLNSLLTTKKNDHKTVMVFCLFVRWLVEEETLVRKVTPVLEEKLHMEPFGVEEILFAEIMVVNLPFLVEIMQTQSIQEGKKKVPTRLTLVASDCIVTVTKGLLKTDKQIINKEEGERHKKEKRETHKQEKGHKEKEREGHGKEETESKESVSGRPKIRQLIQVLDNGGDKLEGGEGERREGKGTEEEMERRRGSERVWAQLDIFVALLKEQYEWNEGERELYSSGIKQILLQLETMVNFRNIVKEEGEEGEISKAILAGGEVLFGRWKHYSNLLIWDDKTLDQKVVFFSLQWIQTLQYYTQKKDEIKDENSPTLGGKKNQEKINHFSEVQVLSLTCLALLLGRIRGRQLSSTLEELRESLLPTLMAVVCSSTEEVLELAISLLRLVIFSPFKKKKISTLPKKGELKLEKGEIKLEEFENMDILPSLMEMMDARDSTARAVVILVAEFFSLNPESRHLDDLFRRLDLKDGKQRANSVDVIEEILSIQTKKEDFSSGSFSERIAEKLLDRLGDEELKTRTKASSLFSKLDPSFILPPLFRLLFATEGNVRSSANSALKFVLKKQCDKCHILEILLDFVSKSQFLSEKNSFPSSEKNKNGKGDSHSVRPPSKENDLDRVMRLIPDWAEGIEDGDWPKIFDLVFSQMWREPSNRALPAVLSRISGQLAGRTNMVVTRVAQQMNTQRELTEERLQELSEAPPISDTWQEGGVGVEGGRLGHELFSRLSPLLVLKVLPLSSFSNAEEVSIYGIEEKRVKEKNDFFEGKGKSILELLVQRACGQYEFEDVRKLSAELLGRLLPKKMLPLVAEEFESAISEKNFLKAKSCLFTICTSLMVREREAFLEPCMGIIQKNISIALSWPLLEEKDKKKPTETFKVQHGCIDCLAIMIRTQLLEKDKNLNKTQSLIGTEDLKKSQNSIKNRLSDSILFLSDDKEVEGQKQESGRGGEGRGERGKEEERERDGREEREGRGKEEVRRKKMLIVELPDGGVKGVENREKERGNRERVKESGMGEGREFEEREETKEILRVVRGGTYNEGRERDIFIGEISESSSGYKEEEEERISMDFSRKIKGGKGIIRKPLIEEIGNDEEKEEKEERRVLSIEELRNSCTEKLSLFSNDVLEEVLDCLTGENPKLPFFPQKKKISASISFRICMANVLISANQKISLAARNFFIPQVIPRLMWASKNVSEGEIRTACLQVLFSSLYPLKDPSMVPYAFDLLGLAMAALESRRLPSERLAGGKILAALLASPDWLVEEILEALPEVQLAVTRVAQMNQSEELRALCEQLSLCLTTVGNNVEK